MRNRNHIRYAIGAALCLMLAALIAAASNTKAQEVVLSLVIDGTPVGTVKPGTFRYELDTQIIRLETNEIVSCQQSIIFDDRFEVTP